jgi:hypothetical protein
MLTIGSAQGYSGDDPRGTREIVDAGVDYICCEALAEFTLTSMHRERRQDERAGFARDIATVAEVALPAIANGTSRLITNAGALNPQGARQAVVDVARKLGIDRLRTGVVLGSDLTGELERLVDGGADLRHMDSGAALNGLDAVEFAAVYLGAHPIADALDQGADVVITGRVADASVFMGPAIFELGVARDDWARLGRLAVMGHLLECSSHATGGNFSGRWWEVEGLDAVGFPIAEVEGDGNCVITKPEGSGGLVSRDTVKEQLLYEVGDPTRYMTPDVVADMTTVELNDIGRHRVAVHSQGGRPASETYKVILSRPAGWIAAAGITYTYPNALAKAREAKHVLDARLARSGIEILETHAEYIGAGALFGATDPDFDPPEIVLRYAVRCASAFEAGAVLGERLTGLAVAGPPGSAASGMGMSMPTPASAIWPTLVDKSLIDPYVRVVVEEMP